MNTTFWRYACLSIAVCLLLFLSASKCATTSKDAFFDPRDNIEIARQAKYVVRGYVLIQSAKSAREDKRRGDGILYGVASGFMVSKDGYVVTNCHVVEGESNVFVHLPTLVKRNILARVVFCDSILSDVAVLKIVPPEKLRVAVIKDSNTVSVGDTLYGTCPNQSPPFYKTTLLRKGEAIDTGRTILPIYDAWRFNIGRNPRGCSGGPVANEHGVVALFTARGPGRGTAFALPINSVMRAARGAIKADREQHMHP